VFLVNSRYPHFSATLFSSTGKPLHLTRAHLLPKLRCQFAEFLNQSSLKRLGISPHPPVSVYGTVTTRLHSRLFLEAWDQSVRLRPEAAASSRSRCWRDSVCRLRVLESPTGLNQIPTTRMADPSPSPLASTTSWWCRNINLLSITYAFRPRLRIRLTLGGLTWPRKPWVFGERVSHLFYRYSCLHKLFQKLQPSFRSTFNAVGMLPYHLLAQIRSFGTMLSPVTFSAQVH
jgi:hypothetical protein